MTAGTQVAIDPRTRKRVNKRVNLLNYIYLAALQLENKDPEVISEEILRHLEKIQLMMRDIWGKLEIERAAENTTTFSELNEGYRKSLENFIDA